MLFKTAPSSCLAITIPPAVYVAGSTIEGEVEVNVRQLHEEDIEEVVVKLRGTSETWITVDDNVLHEAIKLVHENAPIWSRGGTYPTPDSDILRIPFSFTLPNELPPSFSYRPRLAHYIADVRYSVTAVGVRKGLFHFNKRHRVPLAVLPKDDRGALMKEAYVTTGWKTFTKEEKIRRGLWGEYSTVHVELAIPNIPVLPLFSDIPYAITITTITAPSSRAKSREHNSDQPSFPPVPRDPHDIKFGLYQSLVIRALGVKGKEKNCVTTILGSTKERRPQAPVESSFPEKEWVPLHGGSLGAEKEKDRSGDDGTKGSWTQRAIFESTFRLNCPCSFAVDNIECSYSLVVNVPFPGIGNDLKLVVPVTVSSGIVKSLAQDPVAASDDAPILDPPPAYWDLNDKKWDADEKE
ncbi:hypothetical protein BD309DRAFT_961800 [Dichomitus squalens]|uniref:Arrestin-like N-terminal domain-containing protein n=1 Tax=Dichomitus squalens TaxID=114155 RepID=A0A4Q9Q9V1_9APHY|nr:hypothetical protein BD309DRAFT_961800 [Dichomitus squalens]TBU64339.1 hypothetical protein BD310DRAFT_839340 [Dichomitus squalens]